MKKSLEALISDLPLYIKGDDDEIYTLTIQPSVIIDKISNAHKCWMAGYLYVSDEMNWLHTVYGKTLFQTIQKLSSTIKDKGI